MSINDLFEIKRYEFNPELFNEFRNFHYAKDLWPVVYILSDGTIKEAYVGETTDTYARMSTHLKNNGKNKLTAVHFITSEKFNKSATLDIESNLIKYFSGDGQYKLINGNIGLANHNYYQKNEIYREVFRSIWNKLRAEGLSKHSLEYIDNSDLFKYSPYKCLTSEQKSGLLDIVQNLLNPDIRNIVVEGGAGTGKTILAVFFFKLMYSKNEDFNFREFGDDEAEFLRVISELRQRYPNPNMALVVPMSSFRKTLKKVFKNIKGLNANMVIGPSEIANSRYDIIMVDESHRLRRRVNLGTYFKAFDDVCRKLGFDRNSGCELDWVIKQSDKAILFYDESQSIKPSDTSKEAFDALKSSSQTIMAYLKSQFRVKGGNDYVSYIDNLLKCKLENSHKIFDSKEYEFTLFDSIKDMISEISLREKESGLSRLVAGYSWKWVSKGKEAITDIEIEGVKLRWNSVSIDWVNSDNAINEVGCIHTTQGYDLNYAGVIFGEEITYNKAENRIEIVKEKYFDVNGKQSISNPGDLKNFILNIYKTLMLRGIKGTYVYVCNKDLRDYFSKHIAGKKSITSDPVLLRENIVPFSNSIPLYNLKAAAGGFSADQMADSCKWIALPDRYQPSEELFACTVEGESMNKIIPNGSVCLFRKYSGGSRDGCIVLVQHTNIQDSDFGSGYTVKEYRSKKTAEGEQWRHKSITLKPLSNNPDYKDIELSSDELSSLKVIGIFECVLSV